MCIRDRYGIAVLLYLPVNLYAGQLNGPKQLITDLLFNGTFYHLWYLPGAMLGAAVVALLCRRLTAKQVLAATGLLYVAGLLGDSYYGLSRQIPGLAHGYDLLFQCFDYTRNGLFFTPLFLALGGWIGSQRSLASKKKTNLCLLLSACCLLGEGLLLHRLGWQRHDSMYIALVPVLSLIHISPNATMKSQLVSRAKAAPSITISLTGFSITLANSATSTPALRNCAKVRS